MRPAVFFDRDGVVNDLTPDPESGLPESPLAPEDVVLLPGAAEALRQAQGAGFAVVGISNQPAAAKGTVTLAALKAVQQRVLELLAADGFDPDGFYLCFHHPDGVDPELRGPCDCRKPAPGLLLQAARDLDLDLRASWIVGDTDSDVEAGHSAGCRTILVEHPGSRHKRGESQPGPDLRVGDISAAVTYLVSTVTSAR